MYLVDILLIYSSHQIYAIPSSLSIKLWILSFQSPLDHIKKLLCSFCTFFYWVSDVDECEVTSGLCGHGGICQNTIGSYTCTQIPGVDCPPGFAFDLNLQSCLGLFTFLLVLSFFFYCMACCRCRVFRVLSVLYLFSYMEGL